MIVKMLDDRKNKSRLTIKGDLLKCKKISIWLMFFDGRRFSDQFNVVV